jgi:hypothetical protein
MLMAHEAIEADSLREREQVETFKQRIAAANMERFDDFYPPSVGEKAERVLRAATRADGTVDRDKVSLNDIPEAELPQSEQEREQLKRWIEEIGAGTINGSITGAELNTNEWTEWQ